VQRIKSSGFSILKFYIQKHNISPNSSFEKINWLQGKHHKKFLCEKGSSLAACSWRTRPCLGQNNNIQTHTALLLSQIVSAYTFI